VRTRRLVLVPALAALLTALAPHGAARAQPQEAAAPPAPPITLQEAVRRAIARNPTWATAQEEIHRADALVEEARSASLPTLYGNATYTRLDSDRTLANGTVAAAANQFNANLLLTVPLIQPHGWAQWSHAGDAADVVRASSSDVGRQVALAVGHAYLAVVAQKRVLEVTQRARDTDRAHYDYAHQRFSGGVGNRIDEVRARQQVASDEAQVQTVLSALAKAREALAVLVGEDGPLDATGDPALPQPPALAGALDGAAQRSDVVAAGTRLSAADHTVRDDWTDYSPYLAGTFQPFYQTPATLTVPTTGWQAQLILAIPFYDGGLRYGQAHERGALRDEARIGVEAALRQARSDVRAAFEAMRRADDALRSAREAADLAHGALDLAALAYREGATTNIEVIDAERQARDAETQVAIAEDNARQTRLDLLSASGRFP
jgi:outer membrane protein TolC